MKRNPLICGFFYGFLPMFGDQALQRFTRDYAWQTCLDIGSGSGEAARWMRSHGREVVTVDLGHLADIRGDYLALPALGPVDAIWCSHVLEHQDNPGLFLQRVFSDLADEGVLAVTVPPAKHQIVGGHVTIWNAGLLLYQLILAGFDCREARVGTYGYNISAIMRKRKAVLPELVNDCGDIERLAKFFPVAVQHGFDGQLRDIRW